MYFWNLSRGRHIAVPFFVSIADKTLIALILVKTLVFSEHFRNCAGRNLSFRKVNLNNKSNIDMG